MTVASKEAINFQVTSNKNNLANELTVTYQEIIDYRNSITSSASERIKNVMDFFLHNTGPKMISIIYKYTGIKIRLAVPKFLMANFAISFEFENDPISAENMIRRYSGLLNNKNYGKYLKKKTPIYRTEKQLIEFANSLNKDTGMIQTGMMEKHMLACKFYFDVYAAFLIKEMGAEACEPLIAPEVTAVVLHEIGHVLSFIEHAADVIFKKDLLNAATASFYANASDKEKLNFVADQTFALYPEAATKLKRVNDYVSAQDGAQGKALHTGMQVFLKTSMALLKSIGVGAKHVAKQTINIAWNASIGGGISAVGSLKDTKNSDYADMPSINNTYCEVLADEYVARFGYSGYFASQLKKIYSWSRITGLGDMKMKQYNTASWYGRMLPWVVYTLFNGDKNDKDYTSEKHRYELLLLNTLKVFKSGNVPDELLADYYKSYQTIKHMLDNPTREQKYTVACNHLHQILSYIVNSPVELVFSGRFERDYERLYNQVQYLSNNELYALAYALRNMN